MTFEELDEIVIPYLGICYRDLSFTEIITSYNGIVKSKVNDHEFLMKSIHNAARLQAFFAVKSNPFGKSTIRRPEELIRFPWEAEIKGTLTRENVKELDKLFPDKI